jgi:predicted membrane protein
MTSKKHYSGRIFWGLVLILVGVLFLLDRMGRLDFGDLIGRWWPLILVAAGLWHLISNEFRDVVGGLFLIVIGAMFQLAKLEILGQSAWHYIWPALIIILGLWVLAGAFRQQTGPKIPISKEEALDAFAIFSGLERRIESQNFRGGKATALLGGIDLDFSQVRLAEGKASIELTAVLGGIDVRVPRHIRVELHGSPVLGGIEDNHLYTPGAEGDQTLYIKATAILGGIEIKD